MARRKGLVASPSSNFWLTGGKDGAPEGTRTPNLLIRSQVLYPIELPAQPGRVLCHKVLWDARA